MRKTRVILSFDDGRKDNYDIAVPILRRYGLTATFNIATAFVDGTISEEDRPCPNEAMTVNNVAELYNQGYEIAAHGDCHRNEIEDIKNGVEKLRKWSVAGERIGFASPNSKLPAEQIVKNESVLRNLGISYVRIGAKRSDILSRIQRKVGEKTGNVTLYCNGFNCIPTDLDKNFIRYSVPVMHNAKVIQVEGIVKRTIFQKSDCILMFHSILDKSQPYYYDTWTWDCRKFEEFCRWLKEQRTWGKLVIGNRRKG